MKNLFVYWVLIITPLLFDCLFYFQYKSSLWVYILLIYFLLYRPLIDGIRLHSLGLLKLGDSWKLLLPFYRWKYFSRIYLGH